MSGTWIWTGTFWLPHSKFATVKRALMRLLTLVHAPVMAEALLPAFFWHSVAEVLDTKNFG